MTITKHNLSTDFKPIPRTTDETVTTSELILDLGQPTTFNVVRLREHLPLGLRVDSFALDSWQSEQWQEFATATGIGPQRLVATESITTSKVRLRIIEASACPAIQEFGLFLMPLRVAEPGIQRDLNGFVTLNAEAPDSIIRYSLDGLEPTETSLMYVAPFHLPGGGTVKARAFFPQADQQSGSATAIFTQSKGKWKILSASSSKPGASAEHAIDENPQTLWIAQAEYSPPAEIAVDMGETLTLQGFNCLPRQDSAADGTPDRYEFYVSDNPQFWGEAIAAGEFSNIKSNRVLQTATFTTPITARYFRFVILRTVDDAGLAAIAEIGVIV